MLHVLLLLTLGFAQSPTPQSAQEQAQAAFVQANALYEKRDNAAALSLYEKAIALHAANPAFHLGRCRVLARLQRHREAVASCSESIKLQPGNAEAWLDRGHFYLNLREFDAALADLVHAEQLSQDNRQIYYHLGLGHYFKGDFRQSAKAFQKCLELAKEAPDVVACSAWLYPSLLRSGQTAEAARVLERIDPSLAAKDSAAYLDRLLLFKGAKKEEEVAATMNADALARPTVGYSIGVWHLLSGRTDRAKEYFQLAATADASTAFGCIAAAVELQRLAKE